MVRVCAFVFQCYWRNQGWPIGPWTDPQDPPPPLQTHPGSAPAVTPGVFSCHVIYQLNEIFHVAGSNLRV